MTQQIAEQIARIESLKNALGYPQGFMTDLARMVMASGIFTRRPIEEYHADMGNVLWWKFPIVEPPYVGTPNDLGQEVVVEMPRLATTAYVHGDNSPNAMPKKTIRHPGARFFVGGWPGYHTHFTPIPIPQEPK